MKTKRSKNSQDNIYKEKQNKSIYTNWFPGSLYSN